MAVILVGAKGDLDIEVEREEAELLGLPYIETSAMENFGVVEAFDETI